MLCIVSEWHRALAHQSRSHTILNRDESAEGLDDGRECKHLAWSYDRETEVILCCKTGVELRPQSWVAGLLAEASGFIL